jgi:hypothetical protein
MRRRPFVVLAFATLSGCSLGDTRGHATRPDGCPVDGLDARDPPPDDLDREAAGSYVEAYEESYVEATEIDRGRYDQIAGPSSNAIAIDPVDGGFLVDVETSWAVWNRDVDALEFEVVDEPDREPVPADHDALEGEAVLQVHLERAIDRGTSVLDEDERGYGETYDRIAAAAGEVDGAIIARGDDVVRVNESNVPGVHGDGYARSRYYVGSGVLYRSSHDEDPRDGRLMECRSPGSAE